MSVNIFVVRHLRRAVRAVAPLLLSILLTACSGGGSLAPEDKVGVSLSAVGHLGRNVGVSDYSVDGHMGGNNSGWGGGGSTSCCVLLPSKVTKPITVEVKWTTCDISHIEFIDGKPKDPDARCKREDHRATVPVNFDVQPGEGGDGLFVHFLPGHKVEVWYAHVGPGHPEYPGPDFPRGPAPPYAPLPDEKPAISSSNK